MIGMVSNQVSGFAETFAKISSEPEQLYDQSAEIPQYSPVFSLPFQGILLGVYLDCVYFTIDSTLIIVPAHTP